MLYVCGITVYDYCHLGHARTLVAFDVIIRYLKYLGYDVAYVRNITDVDDKIIHRAQCCHEDINVFTERFIEAFHKECEQLKLLSPMEEPRATVYMSKIIQLIEKLHKQGFAYVGKNGDVFFHVDKFLHYGALSNRDIGDLLAGARVEIMDAKKNPLDFALWKLAKPGEPFWESPWGKGRPGWHIECSAMAMDALGPQIDIHGGGSDLIFPHHENEIAQTEAITRKQFANYWIHVGLLQIDKEKMSKSLGNSFTIRDVLKIYHPEVIRYFLMASHYRSPLSYHEQSLALSYQALQRLYIALRGLPVDFSVHEIEIVEETSDYCRKFMESMDDDFNTPEAIAVLFEIAKEINRIKARDLHSAILLGKLLVGLGRLLGILQEDPQVFLARLDDDLTEQKITEWIRLRNEARKNKNWVEADRIRNTLKLHHIILEDSKDDTLWRKEL